MATLSNFVGGQWVAASGTRTLPVENPATGEILAHVPLSTRADLDRAVAAAQEAFVSWRQVPAVERARYLFRYNNERPIPMIENLSPVEKLRTYQEFVAVSRFDPYTITG